MFDSEILEVGIGLALVYLLLSVVCSSVREAVEGWFKTRAVKLEERLRELLHDTTPEGLVEKVYQHPLVSSLYHGTYRPTSSKSRLGKLFDRSTLPPYIPAGNFAVALLDVDESGSGRQRGGAAGLRGAWYNSTMDRVSGWYKRRSQLIRSRVRSRASPSRTVPGPLAPPHRAQRAFAITPLWALM